MVSQRAGSLLALVLGVSLCASVAPGAEFYRYVDEDGVVHLTDAPVDPRYTPYDTSSVRLALDEVARGDRGRLYDALIARAARTHGLPPALVKAVVRAESNFQPRAVSRKGAQGLMQLMPATAAALGVHEPLRPDQNVWGGTRYLRDMIQRYRGDWRTALAAYNAGPTAVDQYGGVPPYPETRAYVDRVLHYYRRYDGDFRR